MIVGVAEGPGAEVDGGRGEPDLAGEFGERDPARVGLAEEHHLGAAAARLDAEAEADRCASPVGGANEIEPGGLIFASSPGSKRLVVPTIAFHGPISGISLCDVGDGRAVEGEAKGREGRPAAGRRRGGRNRRRESPAGPGGGDQHRLGARPVDQRLDAAEQLEAVEARRAEAVERSRGSRPDR